MSKKGYFSRLFSKKKLMVVYGSSSPQSDIIPMIKEAAGEEGVEVREAFSVQGVMELLPMAGLVILDEVLSSEDFSREVFATTLDGSGIPVVVPSEFRASPTEVISRARLAKKSVVKFLPSRQINFVNWSGGVGKSTLAMTTALHFNKSTQLPVAIIELSPAYCAVHARVKDDLPSFYDVSTGATPGAIGGVDLYPVNLETQVLLDGASHNVDQTLRDIWANHTLVIVDAFMGHPMWQRIANTSDPKTYTFAVSSPRDDATENARRLKDSLLTSDEQAKAFFLMNMVRDATAQMGMGADVALPNKVNWAAENNGKLADPILKVVYPGWSK